MNLLLDNLFGLRIKRASDLVGDQGRDAFWRTGIKLDALLTSIVIALHDTSGQTSTELSNATGLSRQLVEARLKQLEKAGYLKSQICSHDARKRTYSLTRNQREEILQVVETMQHFENVYRKLWREIGVDLDKAIHKFEKALHSKPLLARLCDEYPEYKESIKISSNDNR